MNGRRLEHGTPEGYDRGCTRHDRCPALPVHGLTCYTAHVRFVSSERRYMSGYDRRLPAAAIARMLGLTPPRSGEPPVAAEPIEISNPADDVEAQIEAYAIAKEKRDRAAARHLRRDTGGGAAADEDHLGATGAPARTAPGPTPDPTPALCPECAAGKHGNCDGTAWDLAADEPTTCSCTHPENTPDNQEQTMPKRKTAPTSTPATKPQPPAKSIDGSGRTKAERAEIRAWAEANGIILGTAGRIPRAVIEEYDAAKGAAPNLDRVHTHIAVDESTAIAAASTTSTDEASETLAEVAAVDTIPAVEALAEELAAGVEPEVGEYVYADASDKLDETRERVDLPISEIPTVIGEPAVTGEPAGHAYIPGDDWAQVAISQDVERARDIAVRLEAENANLVAENSRMGGALEFALRSWAAADEQLAAEHARTRSARALRLAANRHLLGTIHDLNEQLEQSVTQNEILTAAARIDAQHITELEAELERLSARRWWQR